MTEQEIIEKMESVGLDKILEISFDSKGEPIIDFHIKDNRIYDIVYKPLAAKDPKFIPFLEDFTNKLEKLLLKEGILL